MRIVLSFFDFTGVAVRPWAEAGYDCICFDLQHDPDAPRVEELGRGSISYVHADLSGLSRDWSDIATTFAGKDVAMVFGFPPCTDLAASGARHWAAKREADPAFQVKAMAMAMKVATTAEALGAPYAIENPAGALTALWRKWNHAFHPCEYGGYLAADDQHPLWPEYIPAQDAYTKGTKLWTGNGFVMPEKRAVEPIMLTTSDGKRGSPQWAKLGGKSLKTKNIRSATPRGFALAAFLANHQPTLAAAA